MTMDELEYDPIAFIPQQRICTTQARNITAYAILGGLFIEAATILAKGSVIGLLLTERSARSPATAQVGEIYWELNANLTALLALLAALSTIYFTYRQFQAKVKADSRQAWIDKLRERIARFIALVNFGQDDHGERCRTADPHEFDSRRLEMELMLNPSEKDHRLLMYLSLRLAFYQSGDEMFRVVHDVRNLQFAIEASSGFERNKWLPIFGPIPEKNTKSYTSGLHDLVGYTLRLAHVVLKREWERVKATR